MVKIFHFYSENSFVRLGNILKTLGDFLFKLSGHPALVRHYNISFLNSFIVTTLGSPIIMNQSNNLSIVTESSNQTEGFDREKNRPPGYINLSYADLLDSREYP